MDQPPNKTMAYLLHPNREGRLFIIDTFDKMPKDTLPTTVADRVTKRLTRKDDSAKEAVVIHASDPQLLVMFADKNVDPALTVAKTSGKTVMKFNDGPWLVGFASTTTPGQAGGTADQMQAQVAASVVVTE